MANYTARNIHSCFEAWQNITSDHYVLSIIRSGLNLEFCETPVCKFNYKSQMFSSRDKEIINSEVDKFLKKKFVVLCEKTTNDFVSPIFTRPKKDETFRMILSLKSFNTFIKFNHCKLETFKGVLSVIKPNCWMASVDLKDAYYSVGIFTGHWKYLKFFWEEQFYQFTAMPNGYGPAVRNFTKIIKKPFKVLQHNGHVSVIYIDDTFLEGDTYAACQQNIFETVEILLSLGFTIQVRKSVLVPT